MQTKKIRVLIVEDSFFMRKVLTELMQTDKEIEVVGDARNGAEAISSCLLLSPDVIIMDYNMPLMNGLDAIKGIMKLQLQNVPRILMFSAYTAEGSIATLNCLNAGAVDYIQKPDGELSINIDQIAEEMLHKIHVAAEARVKEYKNIPLMTSKATKRNGDSAKKLLVLGASTGGPPLVEYIVTQLPQGLNMGVVVVQHMPKYFTANFAKRLDQLCPLKVKEASDGEIICANQVYIAPGNCDLSIVDEKVVLHDAQDVKVPHPSINTTISSAAKSYKENLTVVILSGMGEDGSSGAAEVVKFGGYVIAQELTTTTIDSMPRSIITLGYANAVLTPENIVRKIIEISKES